ncbi:MAG: LPS export ABC transporter permease LptG [Syntrophobacterales bacterium]|jgi:lipopolysaccharide export system permease protein|nr:LPS export ABC transporter permease LptG [Syntrophobacterales bacterium]
MKIIDRYILGEFFRFLIMCLLLFVSLFLVIDFFERLRFFISNQAAVKHALAYVVCQIPMVISLTLPVAVLIATMATLSIFSKNSEITAMKATGISLYRIGAPILLAACLITMILFFFSEWVTPKANQKVNHIMRVEIKKEAARGSFKQEGIWYRGEGGIYNFNSYDPKEQKLQGISLYFMTPDFRPQTQILAKEAYWRGKLWEGYQVQVITISPDGAPSMDKFDQMIMPIREKPADFGEIQLTPGEMGFFDLRRYARKLVAEGGEATPYLADMHAKIAFAFVPLILTITGILFSVRSERSGGIARSIGLGVIIGFSYWIVHAFSISFGRSGILPPIAAAWVANALFVIAIFIIGRRVTT